MSIINPDPQSPPAVGEPGAGSAESATPPASGAQEAPPPAPSVPAPASPDAGQTTLTRDPVATLKLKPRVIEALSTIFDPEIPVNIYELGLIYDVIVDARQAVKVEMTLTAPNCPAAQILPGEVKTKVAALDGVSEAHVEVVWEPPWSMDRMSEAAKLQLGML